MPWKETGPMKERVKFVVLAEEKRMSFAKLCDLFGICRKTGYKWMNRFSTGDIELENHSTRPHGNRRALPPKKVNRIVALRKKHPTWGPKKLAVLMKEESPEQSAIAASTIGDILAKKGLVKKRIRRRKVIPNSKPMLTAEQSNDVWCVDFKGHFLVGDGKRCHPLTVTDHFTRYLVCCESLESESIAETKKIFVKIFKKYGLPKIILSDNGSPFASKAPGGLTKLSAWWIKLGIIPIRIQPGHPEQNGRHERMHRTLKAETARPSSANLSEQQKSHVKFMREYNKVRPHEALDQKRPADLYCSSTVKFSDDQLEYNYPGHMEKRRVKQNGEFKWKGRNIYLSEALAKETVGLEEVADGTQLIHFCGLAVALLQEDKGRITCLPSELNKLKLLPMSPV